MFMSIMGLLVSSDMFICLMLHTKGNTLVSLTSCYRRLPFNSGVLTIQGLDVMRMYEEHAMTAIYMNSEMSHHGDPGQGDNTESYHPGLVIEQLNKVCSLHLLSRPQSVSLHLLCDLKHVTL